MFQVLRDYMVIYFGAALFALSIGLYFYIIRIKKIDKKRLVYGAPTAINIVGCYFIAKEFVSAFIIREPGSPQIIATAVLQIVLALGVMIIAERLFSPAATESAEEF